MKNMETSNYEDRFAKELLEAERSVEGIKDDKRSYVNYTKTESHFMKNSERLRDMRRYCSKICWKCTMSSVQGF